MSDCCEKKGTSIDWIWAICTTIVLLSISIYFFSFKLPFSISTFAMNITMLLKEMWIGILFGVVAVGILDNVPSEFIQKILITEGRLSRILRATVAGFLLDLCSHGILLVGLKLYKKGMTIGQLMAFLIASPWNSFSLTLILIALIGIKWTLAFIFLSFLIAVISGLIFEVLSEKGIIKGDTHIQQSNKDFLFWKELNLQIKSIEWKFSIAWQVFRTGVKEAKFIVRWLLLGTILASLIQTYFPAESFQEYFGPTMLGLFLTLVSATIIEVCSEGSAPIAADLLNRATAPGNAFAFLMAGASTDYTEIMGIRETTKSWKIALFLPLVTIPQIIILSHLINQV